jgi:hypothetical protein
VQIVALKILLNYHIGCCYTSQLTVLKVAGGLKNGGNEQ